MTLTQGQVLPQSFSKYLVNPEGGLSDFRVLFVEGMRKEKGKQWSQGLVWVLFGVHGKEARSYFFCEMGFLGILAACTLMEGGRRFESGVVDGNTGWRAVGTGVDLLV